MARSLVIVESPAKAKTINKYLGRNYSVKASLGHVMDLPKKVFGIPLPDDAQAGDPETFFVPTLETIPGKTKVINELKKAAKEADAVYLAGDPDREGEAICAHLAQQLGRNKTERKKIFRVMFNEITAKAIKAAFEKPGEVNTNLVDAQQARRVLDRIVGYKISPLLWDKVRRGLSAGRVQTVALRLIVEREVAIRAFQKREYWTIHALLAAAEPPIFEAKLWKYKGADLDIPSEAEAQRVLAELEPAKWLVSGVTQKEKRRYPAPPFTTSKLQQAAFNKLRFTTKRTMALAQRLYEGVELGEEGAVALITYMRTDSVRVGADALAQVRDLIGTDYGATYLPEKPIFYKSKKDAQDAHEAIRPTDVARTPDSVRKYLDDDMYRLYRLIWQRFVASQMVPAVFDQTTIDIAAGDYQFRASGAVLKFNGFLAAYEIDKEELEEDAEEEGRALPVIAEGERLRLADPQSLPRTADGAEAKNPRGDQHFTEPPPRYTEATLVKELEEKGIGRPSTYSSIISTIVDREYVSKEQGRLAPTMLGEKVSELLVKSFEDIFDVGFTARMEEELDEIEEGKLPWRNAVKDFYDRFALDLEQAKGDMESYKAGIKTGKKCEKCGKGELLERISRHGFFLGCDRYPDCDFTQDISPEPESENVESEAGPEYCENCGKEMTIKRGRFGPFLACTGYPDCKTTRRLVHGTRKARQPDQLLDEKCPECGAQLVLKHGRFGEFTGCTAYPKCKFIRSKTLGIPCPKCETGELVERMSKKGRMRRFYGCNKYPACDFTTPYRPIHEPCPKCGAKFVVEKRSKNAPAVRTCLKEGCDWEIPAPESAPAEAAAS
ncbi:MAG: type I DNA topoisomerase [Acidobacteria bacterium]|nr:type I DNA topoisomerase [Acidobacteriota bacterium]